MKPTSLDLRERILEALVEEPSSLKVGKRFKVSASSVRKLRLKVDRTGIVAAGKAPGKERLVQDRACRVAWLFGRRVDLTATLFAGLLALCDQWTASPDSLLPVETVIELSSGKRHIFGYDDAKRLRAAFGCRELIRMAARRGYALRKLEMPPVAARRTESGVRRATGLRQ